MDANIVEDLLNEYSDEKRLYLIADNPDWDRITPALSTVGALFENGSLSMVGFFTIIRVFFEICYVMGYNRGIKDGIK